MSHWTKGKLKIKCSLAILQKTIVKIMPRWKDYIVVDESGKLSIFNSYTKQTETGFHLMIPGSDNSSSKARKAPDLNYADIGFRKNKDGTWSVQIDRGGLPYDHRNLENEISEECARQTLEKEAQLRGWGTSREEDGSLIVVRPVETYHLI